MELNYMLRIKIFKMKTIEGIEEDLRLDDKSMLR